MRIEREEVLTTITLMTPKTPERIPLAMTMRQNGRPSDSCDVASLLRFPRIETPTIIMKTPRVVKPEQGDRSGQFFAK